MSNRLQIPRNDEIEILNVETPFEGYFRVDRYRFRHRLYRGGWSAEVSREVFERGHAVGVLLYDPPLDRVVLVEQIRLPSLIGGGPARTLEIAAGIIDPGETIARVARREAHEETGLNILALKKICRYFASPGGTTERVDLFVGRVDASSAGGVFGGDDDEDIKVISLGYEEVMASLDAGNIVVASTIIALQWLALNRDRLRAEWN